MSAPAPLTVIVPPLTESEPAGVTEPMSVSVQLAGAAMETVTLALPVPPVPLQLIV